MNTPTIYTYAKCDTCRQALRWLRKEGIEFHEKPIRETPPRPAVLRAMLDHVVAKCANCSIPRAQITARRELGRSYRR